MKLYFTPRTRAARPRWLLEELEVPYELVKLDPRNRRTGPRSTLRSTRSAHPLRRCTGEGVQQLAEGQRQSYFEEKDEDLGLYRHGCFFCGA